MLAFRTFNVSHLSFPTIAIQHASRIIFAKSPQILSVLPNIKKLPIFTHELTGDDYEVKIAETIEEAIKLLEVGFDYVTDMDGKKLFRKRK